jgi:predicted short-subunit dehydrogenase-like oxidoreductase (DUF2520 family)
MTGPPLLHVLGCGRTARSVVRVLVQSGAIRVGQVVNRSLDSARDAVSFIGAGQPETRFDALSASDWLLLGLPDGELEIRARELPALLPRSPGLVFHLSGSIGSGVLAPICAHHAAVHPLRAFSDPGFAVEHFHGTWCAAEGQAAALEALRAVFEQGGARWVEFAPKDKAAWHAATVAASNFLVVINALARELAEGAGIDEGVARQMLADLQGGTLKSLEAMPASRALTGPFERADLAACQRLQTAVDATLDGSDVELFAALARAAVALARVKRGARDNDDQVTALFRAATNRSD